MYPLKFIQLEPKLNRYYLCLLTVVVLFSSCAQMAVPTGGEKDLIAPELKESGTFPKNFSTNFKEKKIVLQFDEFIKLNNPQQQILVSPALSKNPVYIVKGKTLSIELPGDLKPNTTYCINFGTAISDITEGNACKNLQYVFSTGDFIDSLSVSGTIVNAISGKPEKGIRIMLSSDLSDSSALKSKPDYFALSDENGNYIIRYVKDGRYQLHGIKDLNGNYLLNNDEAIAFESTLIDLEANGQNSMYNLILFEQKATHHFIRKKIQEHPGKMTYVFNMECSEITQQFISEHVHSDALLSNWKSKDTLEVFYPITEEREIVLRYSANKTDTSLLSFKEREIQKFLESATMLRTNFAGYAELNGRLRLKLNIPIAKFYKDKIILFRDSIKQNVSWSQIDPYTLESNYSFAKDEKNNYQLIVEENALEPIYKLKNKPDTLRFVSRKSEYYGVLLLKLSNPYESYIFQLLNDKGKIVYKTENGSVQDISVNFLQPGNYQMRLLIDEDKDQQWTTGNYLLRKQPEKIINYNGVVQIRSNWDVELSWIIK